MIVKFKKDLPVLCRKCEWIEKHPPEGNCVCEFLGEEFDISQKNDQTLPNCPRGEKVKLERQLEKDFKILAERIWSHGTCTDFRWCFVPSEFVDRPNDFNKISDRMFNKYKATHYNIEWVNRGITVKVTLGSGEEFGACNNIATVFEKIVEL